jgi:glucokinase
MFALALDMGGTHIGCGVVENERLLAHEYLPTDRDALLADLLPEVVHLLQRLITESGKAGDSCLGVAVGFPGIVDARSCRITSTLKKYADAPELDLAGWALRSFDAPLRIENDARLALLGEQFAGAARGANDVVMLTLGTGIGSAAILDGRILRGVHAHAGCLGGHMTVNFDGQECHCGNVGCAEAEAGGWALPSIVSKWPGFEQSSISTAQRINFQTLFEQAAAGDSLAQQVRSQCLRVWAATIVSLVHAYDPELVIIGGGVMNAEQQILPFVQNYLDRHTWSSWGKVRVKAAALGNCAALHGSIPLLKERM